MENHMTGLQQLFPEKGVELITAEFILNLIAAAFFAYILGKVYAKYGAALSNRRMFAQNFVLLAMTTTLIISLVKSSLALSLGLVGALSIIRFRTAVKEPEELSYLFLVIAIGLGFGANQGLITSGAVAFIMTAIGIKARFRAVDNQQNLYLTLSSHIPEKVALDAVISILRKYCSLVTLKRFDETKDTLEASFFIEYDSFDRLMKSKTELLALSEGIKISFLDKRGLTE